MEPILAGPAANPYRRGGGSRAVRPTAVAFSLLALVLAGCSGPEPEPVTTTADDQLVPYAPPPPPPPPGPAEPREESGEMELHTVDAYHCQPGNGVFLDHRWEFIPLERQPRDTSLAIRLTWEAVNPTATEVHLVVRDRPEPGGPVYLDQWGRSAQEVLLLERDLAAWNATMYLQVGLEGCPPEQPVAVHVVPPSEPQPVHWRLRWNDDAVDPDAA